MTDTSNATTGESPDSTKVEASIAQPSESEHTPREDLTTNRKLRWDLLASIVAGTALCSLFLIVGMATLGAATLSALPQGWFLLYTTVVLTATVWTFGAEALGKAREAMNGE